MCVATALHKAVTQWVAETEELGEQFEQEGDGGINAVTNEQLRRLGYID